MLVSIVTMSMLVCCSLCMTVASDPSYLKFELQNFSHGKIAVFVHLNIYPSRGDIC